MIEVECTARKIGNSIGFTLPKEIIEEAGIKENQKVTFLIPPVKDDIFKRTFGTLKFKKSTDEMMREIDKELWGIE
jgi:antitoxin component of MazEF toxin-antitoxin module